jgi:cell wall-associated NlpC family hydrolase
MTTGLQAVQSRMAELRRMIDSTAPDAALRRGTPGTAATTSGARSAVASAAATRTGAPADDFAALMSALGAASGVGTAGGSDAVGQATGGPSSGKGLGEKVVGLARRYLGVPYRWGGTNPATGLDCSGLTQLVYRKVGVELPRVSRDQAREGREVGSVAAARPGDLVFFDSPVDHVGIYVGNNKILHAPHAGERVKISKIWERPSHIRRVLPETATSGASTSSVAVQLERLTAGLGLGSTGSGTPAPAGVATTGGAGAPVRAGTETGTGTGTGLGGPYADLFTAAGRRHGVDPALLSAVAKVESGYDARAVSGAGARGLMQIMPGTARGLGVDAMDPRQAVDGAARLLSQYLDDYSGRVDLALAAYNAGPGAVRKYGGIPPYAETREYVQRVNRTWEALR